MIKNIKYIPLMLSVLFLASCGEDALDLSPLSTIGENGFYENARQVEGGVLAIYDGLQDVPIFEYALTEMRSDNTKTKSSEGDWAQFESFTVQPTNLAVGTYWKANYSVIFRANRILENLEVVEDATLKGQYEGEAKFARALSHFNLVRAYGDVPYIDRVVIQTDTDYFDKDATATVYAGIVSDLTSAISTLPSSADTQEGRATRGAAQGLLAKVYLTLENYTEAKELLVTLLADTDYALVSDYNEIFYNEMNSEIIFAIPYTNDDANEAQDFSFEMTVGGRVSGLNFVTNDFASAVDPADTRIPTLYNPNSTVEVGKFMTTSSDVRLCGNDWIVLRLADVFLMHAEAIMGGNASTQSLDAIASYNTIRDRAGLSLLATDGSETLTKEMLSDERRVELAFENHRFYDLVRMGMASSVLSAFATSEGYSYEPTDVLLPIPQAEIDVSQGLLIQNAGY
jgi:hypothetical protein